MWNFSEVILENTSERLLKLIRKETSETVITTFIPPSRNFANVNKISWENFCRSSRPKVFCKKSVLRNFAEFAGKHLCQSLFLNKVAGLRSATLFKKKLAQVFSCGFCKISKNTFSYRTPPVAASDFDTLQLVVSPHTETVIKEVNITIEFCIFELVLIPNFSLNWKFWFVEPNLPQKDIYGQKQKMNITTEF